MLQYLFLIVYEIGPITCDGNPDLHRNSIFVIKFFLDDYEEKIDMGHLMNIDHNEKD